MDIWASPACVSLGAFGQVAHPSRAEVPSERRMVAEPSPEGAERSHEAPAGSRQGAASVTSSTRVSVSHHVPWSLGLRSMSWVPSHPELRWLRTRALPALLIACDVGGLGSAFLGGRCCLHKVGSQKHGPQVGPTTGTPAPGFSTLTGLPNSPVAPREGFQTWRSHERPHPVPSWPGQSQHEVRHTLMLEAGADPYPNPTRCRVSVR